MFIGIIQIGRAGRSLVPAGHFCLQVQVDPVHGLRSRDIAYKIIAARIPANPAIVSELRHFNDPDKQLVKDTIRFQVGRNHAARS